MGTVGAARTWGLARSNSTGTALSEQHSLNDANVGVLSGDFFHEGNPIISRWRITTWNSTTVSITKQVGNTLTCIFMAAGG